MTTELRVPIQQWAIQAKQESKSEPPRDPFVMMELERVFAAVCGEFEDRHPGRKDRALRRRFYVSPYSREDE